MSDNKKYYYLKLKDNYFDQDNIRVLEAQENGYIYSLIILKLYLKSVKHEGRLMMTEKIPYDPRRLDILARVLNHDVAHIKDALRLAQELDIIALMETGEIWMTDIQNFIGHSSTEADRKREYRKKIDGQMSRQLVDKYPPELEKEIESEIEIKRERKKKPSAKAVSTVNPLYHLIQQFYLLKNNNQFPNFGKEGKAIHRIVEMAERYFPENTSSFLQAMMKGHYMAYKEKVWFTKNGLLPSGLSANWGAVVELIKTSQPEEAQWMKDIREREANENK